MESERSLADSGDGATREAGVPPAKRSTTREALLEAAMNLFSARGYTGTSIRDLAREVGIRESSVYKHFPSKQALFEALIERAHDALAKIGSAQGLSFSPAREAAEPYRGISEKSLLLVAQSFFTFVLHDPDFSRIRRLMQIERYREPAVASHFADYFIVQPLSFHTELFRQLLDSGEFREGLDAREMAVAFFGPVFMLIDYAESEGGEPVALDLLQGHVHHFLQVHARETV